MHGYRTTHGGYLNESDNFKEWKLIIHGYKDLHGAILTKMKIIKRDKQRYYLVDLLGWKHSRNFLILCCLPLPLVYHYGNWYGSQTVFTSPFLARNLLARLGSNFLVATNAQDSHTEVKSNRARQHH